MIRNHKLRNLRNKLPVKINESVINLIQITQSIKLSNNKRFTVLKNIGMKVKKLHKLLKLKVNKINKNNLKSTVVNYYHYYLRTNHLMDLLIKGCNKINQIN